MMTTPTPQVVISYLAQLDSALRGVDPGVRDEILAGIREELQGLDAAASAARIEELGDPEFIAAEARAASPVAAPQTAPPLTAPVDPGHGYALFAAVFLIVGSIIFPFLGGAVGLGLVIQSRAWSKRERLVTVIVPIVSVAIAYGVSAFLSGLSTNSSPSPSPDAVVFTMYVVLVVVCAVEGFVLMARGYGRNWRR